MAMAKADELMELEPLDDEMFIDGPEPELEHEPPPELTEDAVEGDDWRAPAAEEDDWASATWSAPQDD
jgi:hypothetical protein